MGHTSQVWGEGFFCGLKVKWAEVRIFSLRVWSIFKGRGAAGKPLEAHRHVEEAMSRCCDIIATFTVEGNNR